MNAFIPGDFLCLDPDHANDITKSIAVSGMPGDEYRFKTYIGGLKETTTMLVISGKILEQHYSLVLTSNGMLGWVQSGTMKRVSERSQNEKFVLAR